MKRPSRLCSPRFTVRALITVLGLCALAAHAQLPIGRDSVRNVVLNSPAFSIFKDNYFVTGSKLGVEPTKYNSDAKFQFSFKQRLRNKPLVWGTYAYLTYTQKSFWDIYQKSKPFAETNYNPGLQVIKPLYRGNQLAGALTAGIEHESNGRDSIYSRSWNFLSLMYAHIFSEKINASIKVWLPFALEDNPDLLDYIGYGEGQFSWTIMKDKLVLDIFARKAADWNWRSSVMTSLGYKPFKNGNQYITLQWWQGYEESLIDYTENVSMLRLGLLLKPTLLRFY